MSAELDLARRHLEQARRAFQQDPTPRLATAMKQLANRIKYLRRQQRPQQ